MNITNIYSLKKNQVNFNEITFQAPRMGQTLTIQLEYLLEYFQAPRMGQTASPSISFFSGVFQAPRMGQTNKILCPLYQ